MSFILDQDLNDYERVDMFVIDYDGKFGPKGWKYFVYIRCKEFDMNCSSKVYILIVTHFMLSRIETMRERYIERFNRTMIDNMIAKRQSLFYIDQNCVVRLRDGRFVLDVEGSGSDTVYNGLDHIESIA